MRLIDADALKSLIAGMAISNNYPANKANALCELIDAQPTAYDPDKVVQQLEDRSTLSRPVGWTKSYEIITLKDAVEIVKGGGVDG